MDVEKVFHMNGGVGKTSYAQNSSLQKKASDMVKHITLETIKGLFLAEEAPTSIGIADLGCSSGPNTLGIVKEIIEAVEDQAVICGQKLGNPHSPLELRVYLNDLPTNDFNSVFKSLPDFFRNLRKERAGSDHHEDKCPSIFVGAYPGSFYSRLFQSNCLHFIHASYSLHWLSKVPAGIYDEQGRSKNKGKVYISETSAPSVFQAYLKQFQEDFFLFLRLRSQELVSGGKMVLVFLGRESQDPVDRGNSFFWELLSRSLANLVSKGEIEEEKLDSYDVNFYAASKMEIEEQVRAEGSFKIERLEMFEMQKDEKEAAAGDQSYGEVVAMTVRAIQESVLCSHFGQGIDLDALFDHYGNLVDAEMAKQGINPVTFILVLAKFCTCGKY